MRESASLGGSMRLAGGWPAWSAARRGAVCCVTATLCLVSGISSQAAELSALDATTGLVINGVNAEEFSAGSLGKAGDVNGDGFADIIIGANNASPNGDRSGASYVVFGGSGVGTNGVLDLATLDGSNGFVLNGVAANDRSGFSVSGVGDVNGDEIDDLIVGSPFADPDGQASSGESYVIFGATNLGSGGSIELSDLDGTNGFVLKGVAATDFSGRSVRGAGDLNNDGTDDLVIGAARAPSGVGIGSAYVVFGANNVGSSGSFSLSSVNGTNGFEITGVAAGDKAGVAVNGAGDVNGDSIDDLLIGALSGDAYVVFGRTNVGQSGTFALSGLNGNNGYRIAGARGGRDDLGIAVSSAGDVNRDGVGDVALGAAFESPNGENSGAAFIVFGGTDVGSTGTFDLATLDGDNGFVMNGVAAGDNAGFSVDALGDFSGDGIDDVVVGGRFASPNGAESGTAYVLFGRGRVGRAGTLELSRFDGTIGDTFNGISAGDQAGVAVAGVGDFNGDGTNDVLIGAEGVSTSEINAGAAYLVFGEFTSGLVAAILPASRSVQVGDVATVFATMINPTVRDATGCTVAPSGALAADFTFRTTDPATNAIVGGPNEPADIAGGASQTFVLAFEPTGPIAPTDVGLDFSCSGFSAAPKVIGLSTVQLSASNDPVPDVVALGSTASNDGTVRVPGSSGASAFSVATVNVGVADTIEASADTGTATLPLTLSICQTDPTSGACLATPGSSTTVSIGANETPTFAVFVQASGNVAFDPAGSRIFVRFKDGSGVVRGATSVAVTTQ